VAILWWFRGSRRLDSVGCRVVVEGGKMSTQEERRKRRETRAQARVLGSQDDQENQMLYQDPEVRKALRSKYRELKQSIAGEFQFISKFWLTVFRSRRLRSDALRRIKCVCLFLMWFVCYNRG
jgi:hypothetical protein